MRPQYVGPWRGAMRALERNMLKFRSMQMMLVIFYADELQRLVTASVYATSRWRAIGGLPKDGLSDHKPSAKRAFQVLVADGVLTSAERDEVRGLIDFRNTIAHELHSLVADLSTETVAHEHVEFSPKRRPFDYDAAERLRHFDRLIGERLQKHGYMISVSFNPMVFRAAERTFLSEIKRLQSRVDRLYAEREREIAALNAALALDGTGLTGHDHPREPLSRYDDGRLTARGVEICYRLFDLGRSTAAVAYLTGLSLAAARKRRKMWQTAGAERRARVDLAIVPKRKFYARYDD